ASEDLNSAVVQTLAESQSDLGLSTAAPEAISPERLQPGARVRVRGFSKPVVLRRVDGSSAEIEAGPLRMKVALDEITAIEESGSQFVAKTTGGPHGVPSPGVTVYSQSRDITALDEINVIGSTVEEATDRVDKFLDEAALANKPRVRIIHGHGTGALRKGLAPFLSSHPLA